MRRSLAAAAVIGVAALAGCGGDDSKDNGTKSAAPASSSSSSSSSSSESSPSSGSVVQTVNVTATDFKLNPANPRLSKPGRVEFKVENDGQAPHTIEVEGPGSEQELQPVLDPGQSGTLEVNLDKPGKFEWYCPVGNHRDLGMEGVITVAGSATDSSSNSGSGGGSRY